MSSTKDWSRGGGGQLDWSAIHNKLDQLEKHISSVASPSDAARESMLQERAILLAKSESAETESADGLELLFFQLSGEDYAIESRFIQGVHPLVGLTELPGVPPFVLGIVYVRGRVVAVIDLGKLFDLPRQGLTDQDRVIVVSDGTIELGLLANVVVGMSKVSEESIQKPLATFSGFRREILMGVTNGQAVVLDMVHLMSHERLHVGKRWE